MSPSDKQTFEQGKPYIIGLIALLFRLVRGWDDKPSLDAAEKFVKEFEARQ
jgi:hypothetical protein